MLVFLVFSLVNTQFKALKELFLPVNSLYYHRLQQKTGIFVNPTALPFPKECQLPLVYPFINVLICLKIHLLLYNSIIFSQSKSWTLFKLFTVVAISVNDSLLPFK